MSKKKDPVIRLSKYSIIILVGFALEVCSALPFMPQNFIKNALIMVGLGTIFTGMILVRMDNPYSDNKESLIAEDLGFDFGGHFEDYRNVLSRKAGSIKYSTWRDDLLKKYNKFGEENGKKKPITQDIRFYLKESRRKALEKAETVKTIMIPAEFGIIASIYELEIGPLTGEMKFTAVLILSAVLCLLCSVEINSANKIVKFIDDFCEILEIDVGKE